MRVTGPIHFPPFVLDPVEGQLRRGADAIALRPKTWAVLRYLLERPGELVTKGDLLDAVWPATAVGEATLTMSIHELRHALGDDARQPRFIETVQRRGFRFMGEVVFPSAVQPPYGSAAAAPFVGRGAELAELEKWLGEALHGKRQIVFVSGEAGIGKTTLIDAFADTVVLRWGAARGSVWVGRGQCFEHYGPIEPYMPVLEALGHLCRGPRGERLVELLRRHAPGWLVQLSGVLDPKESAELGVGATGSTREHMLRMLADAVEAVTAEAPVVLILEDLHWSDHATMDLLIALAQRREPARLLVLASLRATEAIAHDHPVVRVKQEIRRKGLAVELALELLERSDVHEYLCARFEGLEPPAELADVVHRHTDGNPFFMVTFADYLVGRGWLTRGDAGWRLSIEPGEIPPDVPDTVRDMIDARFAALPPEQRQVLEAASVAGFDFPLQAVAACVERSIEEVDGVCAELARRQEFVRSTGEGLWPDGSAAPRYCFIHAIGQSVVYQRQPISRRRLLHRRVAERLEGDYGDRAGEIAAELAMHFERAGDADRASRHHEGAAANATRRFADREAAAHLLDSLRLLEKLPDDGARTERELRLRIALGQALLASRGFAAPEVEAAYARALELSERSARPSVAALLGLCSYYFVRAELAVARRIAERVFEMGRTMPASVLRLGHAALGVILYTAGELSSARAHLEESLAIGGPQSSSELVDTELSILSHLSWALAQLGHLDLAAERGEQLLRHGRESRHPFQQSYALILASNCCVLRAEHRGASELADAVIAQSAEYGFPLFLAGAKFNGAWARALSEGASAERLAEMIEGLAAYEATGHRIDRAVQLAQLAQIHIARGERAAGLEVVERGLVFVEDTGVRSNEAELHRLKGELLLQGNGRAADAGSVAAAEPCFREAMQIARRQQSKLWELRAAVSLARLWQRQNRTQEASNELAPVYTSFSEGLDSVDLREAATLLRELNEGAAKRRRHDRRRQPG